MQSFQRCSEACTSSLPRAPIARETFHWHKRSNQAWIALVKCRYFLRPVYTLSAPISASFDEMYTSDCMLLLLELSGFSTRGGSTLVTCLCGRRTSFSTWFAWMCDVTTELFCSCFCLRSFLSYALYTHCRVRTTNFVNCWRDILWAGRLPSAREKACLLFVL